MNEEHLCPVCGQFTFPYEDSYMICPVCDWMDDAFQVRYPDEGGCANIPSLNEYRAKWKAKQARHE